MSEQTLRIEKPSKKVWFDGVEEEDSCTCGENGAFGMGRCCCFADEPEKTDRRLSEDSEKALSLLKKAMERGAA